MKLTREQYETLSPAEKQKFASTASPEELAALIKSVTPISSPPKKIAKHVEEQPPDPISNLFPCKDCGNIVSRNARSCPKCGAELKVKKSAMLYISLGALCLGMIILGAILLGRGRNTPDGNEIKPNSTPVLKPAASTATASSPALPTAPNPEEQKIDALSSKPLFMSAEEKTARDNILKALLDVSSATGVGVQYSAYGDLVGKARSVLTFEETKLSAKRHEKFLSCAEKAIGYYARALNDWNDYFKYDFEREKDITIMSEDDFADFRSNGQEVASNYPSDGAKGFYDVPFNESLSMYWRAADIYIEKMKEDVQK